MHRFHRILSTCAVFILAFCAVTFGPHAQAEEKAPTQNTQEPTHEEQAQPKEHEEEKLEQQAEKHEEQKQQQRSKRHRDDYDEQEHGYGKTRGLLGKFLFGPSITAVALPRPLQGNIEAKYAGLFGASAGYGFFPEVKVNIVKAKINGWDARLRVYPWRGAFFLGVAYGMQTFTGNATKAISGIETNATIEQDNSFVAPHVGWNWTWKSGFFMGLDVGVQLSVHRDTKVSSNITNTTVLASGEYQNLVKDVQDKADKIGKTPLPFLTLLKVGFLF